MINLTREEAQSVLDALDGHSVYKVEAAIKFLRARLSAPECVCGEPYTVGVHRQDGPCYQQPEPEPVAWMYDFPNPDNPREDMVRDWVAHSLEEVERCRGFNVRPLYTAPPQREWKYDPMTGEPLIDGWPLYSGLPKPWQGLTDEEIKSLLWETRVDNLKFARVIETLLREKNAS